MLKTIIKRLNHSPLSRKEQGLFAERLALLLGASMSLPESIAIMRHTFGKRRATPFVELESSLDSGVSFESVLSSSTLNFSRTIILAARIGERSGTLAESLIRAAGQIERRRAVQSSLISALTYPSVIFLASVGIISFLVFFIMPKIMPTIESLHVPLPAVTVFFISISHFLASDWWKILLTILFIGVVFYFFYNKSRRFRNFTHQCIIHIPIVSRIIRANILAEIFDTISTLVSGGCPFIESVSECSSFIGFIPYRTALSQATKKMQTGSSFSSVMVQYLRLFPNLVVDSIAIGERTGSMEAILLQMSRYYARELETALTGFSKLIEPALMIVVGIIVGAAALSIVLPIYAISQHLSG
jgi:type II secretory pathway component PulF